MLLKRSGEFIAFGFEAEQLYNDAHSTEMQRTSDVTDSVTESADVTEVLENLHDVKDVLLFKHFKMMLLNSTVIKTSTQTCLLRGVIFFCSRRKKCSRG